MAFVILSTGPLARSGLHTVKMRTIVLLAGASMLGVLAGGVALGFRIGQSAPLAGALSASQVLPLDPDQPESRALINRVGTLSGRLIRLESEAVSLARQVGVLHESNPGVGDQAAAQGAPEPAPVLVPSGGPLVAPASGGFPALLNAPGDEFAISLSRVARHLDRIEATFGLVAQATALQNLDSMAFPSRLPVDRGRISSGFGNRRDPFTRRLARHTGVDMPAPHGSAILASAGGRVRLAGYRSAYGNTVEIDHGNGLATRYGHASKLFVRTGDIVLPGQRIAAVGSTGRSTGPHLHFEVIRNGAQVEPRLYLARNGH
jgi:murein DD-endopeptidase MepM/ murein hydrolase activator NlpD